MITFDSSVLERGKFHPNKVIQTKLSKKKLSKKKFPQISDVKNIIQKSYPNFFIQINATSLDRIKMTKYSKIIETNHMFKENNEKYHKELSTN